jgi:glycerol kinase
MEAMAADAGEAPTALRVDGGMVANDWFLQRLANLTGLRVDRPKVTETTALGAAYLAGLGAGLYASTDDLAAKWALDAAFEPAMSADERDKRYAGWRRAVARVQSTE